MLTQEEQNAKIFLIDKFVPQIRGLFRDKNPSLYEFWGTNCCRQIAVFGADYMTEMLRDYKFEVWDGIFEDEVDGHPVKYNHAWIYGINKSNGRKLFIDVARNDRVPIFNIQKNNSYDRTVEGFSKIKEISRQKLNWNRMIKTEREYYTGMSGDILISKLNALLKGVNQYVWYKK